MADHAHYARWAIAASLTIWFSAYIQYFVLGPVGFKQVGAMRALDTVLLPYHQYLAAMSAFLLPAFAVRLGDGRPDARRFVVATAGALVAQAAAVCIVLAFAGESLMSLLFGSKYAGYEHLLPWYALILVPETLAMLLMCLWRSQVRTRLVFVYNVVFTAVLIGAVAGAVAWGVSGVVVARIASSYGVLVLFLAWGGRRLVAPAER